jgi:hypothetical protein
VGAEELDASEVVFIVAVGLLALVNCAQQDGFVIGLLCGVGGAFVAWAYYLIVRIILEAVIDEVKGRAIARKLLEVIGLAVVMAVLIPKITGK